MLVAQRHQKILELLRENNVLPVEHLANILNVSQMTIRRDLKILHEQNLLERTYGGAFIKQSFLDEHTYEEKEKQMIPEKKRIAAYAAEIIEEGQSIMLDAGTTTMEIAKAICSFKDLTVLTNDLKIALYLAEKSRLNIIICGGEVSCRTKSCNDPVSMSIASKFNVNTSFIGCNSFSLEHGACTSTITKAYMKQTMINACENLVLVADGSKYGGKSMSKIAALHKFDTIITNAAFFDSNTKQKHTDKDLHFIYT